MIMYYDIMLVFKFMVLIRTNIVNVVIPVVANNIIPANSIITQPF